MLLIKNSYYILKEFVWRGYRYFSFDKWWHIKLWIFISIVYFVDLVVAWGTEQTDSVISMQYYFMNISIPPYESIFIWFFTMISCFCSVYFFSLRKLDVCLFKQLEGKFSTPRFELLQTISLVGKWILWYSITGSFFGFICAFSIYKNSLGGWIFGEGHHLNELIRTNFLLINTRFYLDSSSDIEVLGFLYHVLASILRNWPESFMTSFVFAFYETIKVLYPKLLENTEGYLNTAKSQAQLAESERMKAAFELEKTRIALCREQESVKKAKYELRLEQVKNQRQLNDQDANLKKVEKLLKIRIEGNKRLQKEKELESIMLEKAQIEIEKTAIELQRLQAENDKEKVLFSQLEIKKEEDELKLQFINLGDFFHFSSNIYAECLDVLIHLKESEKNSKKKEKFNLLTTYIQHSINLIKFRYKSIVSENNLIALEDEINAIKSLKYILKYRIPNFHFDTREMEEDNAKEFKIAAGILHELVWNAYKHSENAIYRFAEINLRINKNGRLQFSVVNSFNPSITESMHGSGLEITKKRLELSYREKKNDFKISNPTIMEHISEPYEDINKKHFTYEIQLEMQLEKIIYSYKY